MKKDIQSEALKNSDLTLGDYNLLKEIDLFLINSNLDDEQKIKLINIIDKVHDKGISDGLILSM